MRSVLAGLILVGLVAAAFLAYLGCRLRASEQAMLAWPTVAGRILESEIRRMPYVPGSATATNAVRLRWALDVRYEYSVGGRNYVGQRVSNSPPTSALSTEAGVPAALNTLAQRYAKGAAVTVRHHPDRPSESLLEVVTGGGQGFLVAAAISLLMAAIAVAVWLATRR